MSSEKKKCCQGCKKGLLGKNKNCQAKKMIDKLSKQFESVKKD